MRTPQDFFSTYSCLYNVAQNFVKFYEGKTVNRGELYSLLAGGSWKILHFLNLFYKQCIQLIASIQKIFSSSSPQLKWFGSCICAVIQKKNMWQSNDEYVLKSWTNLSRLITVTAPLSKTWMLFNPFFWRKCESLYIFQFQGMYTWLLFCFVFHCQNLEFWKLCTSLIH